MRPRISLSELGPHLIAAAEKLSTPAEFPPIDHTGPLFAYATRFLLAAKQHCHGESNAVIDEITGRSLEYHHLVRVPRKDVWIRAFANNLSRLSQGVGTRMPAVLNTVFFVPKSGIPRECVVTYAKLVSLLRLHKSKVHRVWCTIGGDKLDFPQKPPPTVLV